jgi:phosphatidylethanolamine/phosphatidyl-N-methylethanolamine N-methyltransferase
MESLQKSPRFKREEWLFFLRFLRSPRTVGAVAPSSRRLASGMVGEMDLSPGARVVEFGPGTGAFTGAIAGRLPVGGRYLGIERDPVFVGVLKKRWPELSYACDSVENLVAIAAREDLFPLDHIISGLPFASLPAVQTLPILDAVEAALRRGGKFTTFQYLHAYALPAARAFRREMGRRFGRPSTRKVVFWNLPPAFVLTWRKPS